MAVKKLMISYTKGISPSDKIIISSPDKAPEALKQSH